MLRDWWGDVKKKLYLVRAMLVAQIGKGLVALLIKSCRVRFDGMEQFIKLAQSEKCILMLWHNRLAIVPYVLSQYTPQILYAAVVSGSRDGEILKAVIQSYKNGRTIMVSHHARYQALREIIRHVDERKQMVIFTPDGPRGPRYEMKPGLAHTALETHAHVIPIDWEAKQYWELKTWDRLRFPKPFTTIIFRFLPSIQLTTDTTIEQAKALLKLRLPD